MDAGSKALWSPKGIAKCKPVDSGDTTERTLLQRDNVSKRKSTIGLTNIPKQPNQQLLLGAMCSRRDSREGMKVP